MNPEDISKLITEDIHTDNGITSKEKIDEAYLSEENVMGGLEGNLLGFLMNLRRTRKTLSSPQEAIGVLDKAILELGEIIDRSITTQ